MPVRARFASTGVPQDYSRVVAKGLPTAYALHPIPPKWWGRWWAHLAFTRINIQLTIRRNEFDELVKLGPHLVNHRNPVAQRARLPI